MNLAQDLFDHYETHKLRQITTRRFNQAQLLEWLRPILAGGKFLSTNIGTSAEGRPLSLVSFGQGPIKVLLWSQMHGDEPTATMAILDILSFLSLSPQHPAASSIRNHLSLLVLPMMNPDGAERFQRRTAQLIDMNRDALRLNTPEARLLKELQVTHKPQFAFNLHDQDPRYTVGPTPRVTAIALLAPAKDEKKSDDRIRIRAKQVAATFAGVMNQFIPGHVARYDDSFEPRAFGDNVQKWGTSTVLVESGGWKDDPEKMFIRQLNYVGLLASLASIAAGEYEQADERLYEQLPLNGKNLYDVILRNVRFKGSSGVPALVVDIGINIDTSLDSATGQWIRSGKVMDIGDLTTFGAFMEIECRGTLLDSAVIAPDKTLSDLELDGLLTEKRR